MTAASDADRVIAQTVDSARRCDGCGERFTSQLEMGEHTCPASDPCGCVEGKIVCGFHGEGW